LSHKAGVFVCSNVNELKLNNLFQKQPQLSGGLLVHNVMSQDTDISRAGKNLPPVAFFPV